MRFSNPRTLVLFVAVVTSATVFAIPLGGRAFGYPLSTRGYAALDSSVDKECILTLWIVCLYDRSNAVSVLQHREARREAYIDIRDDATVLQVRAGRAEIPAAEIKAEDELFPLPGPCRNLPPLVAGEHGLHWKQNPKAPAPAEAATHPKET
ncbi:hypothetical protein BC835DRAFT_1411484 [Cytidiella melzeri]|nr:hypothetical protein BC835DRAFT_1411484 [Cytidiella melzeri]